MNFLIEAAGSLTSGYIIKAIHEAGHFCVASDIDPECFGRYLADDFMEVPNKNDIGLWNFIEASTLEKNIDIVIPSFDETLLGWAERHELFKKKNIHVILSPKETIAVFQDKWKTYKIFREQGIPTPETSLSQEYQLVKPRLGRGSTGVKIYNKSVDMTGMVSQELLEGVEYTVDVFCDRESNPVYIVPRKRIGVRDGKSTGGITERQDEIIKWCQKICKKNHFIGPINIQAFLLADGSVKIIEINPRIAGGMALGFAATENWINLIVDNIIGGKKLVPKPIRFGTKMRRYYAEVFVP